MRKPTFSRRKANTMSKPRTPTMPEMPYIEDDSRVQAEIEKYDALTRQQQDYESQLAAIPKGITSTGARAAAILRGEDPYSSEAAVENSGRELRRRIDDLEQAKKLQQQEIEATRTRVRVEARRALLPEHARLAFGVAAALDKLAEALDAELRFRDALDAHSIYHGGPMTHGTLNINGRAEKENGENLRREADLLRKAHEPNLAT